MAFDRLKLLKKHTVYPASSPPRRVLRGRTKKAPYGSWCTPDTTPKRAPLTKTNSNVEPRTHIKEDAQNKNSSIIPVQKVKLLTFVTPKKCQTREVQGVTVTELEAIVEPKTEETPVKKDSPKDVQKVVQEVDTPQSPVPSSPSRSKKCEGFTPLPFCDPFLPIDPQGRGYISWLLLVTFCYSYNAWCIALRATFPYQTPQNTPFWMTADYICDVVYLLDVFFVKPRLMFLHEGFWVDDPALTRKNYRNKIQFKFDMLSLLPLDILYIYFGTLKVILRTPRLLKLQTFWEFHQAMDRVLASPYVVRIGKSLFYIFYLIHLNACTYYAMSSYIGLASNGWVYDNQGNAYLRCFYFATKTATSIGKNPKPENTMEYLFMTGAWLMGVFVFALLIGQIRDIIATATRRRTEYRKKVDGCRQYLSGLNMPSSLQRRITCWFSYTWSQQRCFDEAKILNSLPYNMKRDVALEVHIGTLSKVQLFRDCSTSLLRDLVLQLRPVSCLPGDVVVRRGDVGHEMYIIKSGECCVMSADESEVLARLCEGSVFGEISLLGLPGLRRRTATVRSRGYSNLFALTRSDLNAALEYHKEAAAILRQKADQILRENAARQAQARFGSAKRSSEGSSIRRRKSANKGDVKVEEYRKRSASAYSKRRPSTLSEVKRKHSHPRASSAASSDRNRTAAPKIVLTPEN